MLLPMNKIDASSLGRMLAARRQRRGSVCPVCGAGFSAFGRQKYDRPACRKRAFRMKAQLLAEGTAKRRSGVQRKARAGKKAAASIQKAQQPPSANVPQRLVWRLWVRDPQNWQFRSDGTTHFINPETHYVQPGLRCPPSVLRVLIMRGVEKRR